MDSKRPVRGQVGIVLESPMAQADHALERAPYSARSTRGTEEATG